MWIDMAARKEAITCCAWHQVASGTRLATQVLNQRDAKDAFPVILIQELGGQSVFQCKKTAGGGVQRNPIASLAWRQLASGTRLATQVLNQRYAKDPGGGVFPPSSVTTLTPRTLK